jgi:hypothetical protein
VPIVPTVSIGAQESQLLLTRGDSVARRLGLKRLVRMEILPLPTKIVTQVLEPIDIAGQFGEDPDVEEVDDHVRSVMQTALDRLAHERRFPILGSRQHRQDRAARTTGSRRRPRMS